MSRYFNEQNTNELYHHGVKGMKWGVRRYQNTDGSYTKIGKSRRSLTSKQLKSIKSISDNAQIINNEFRNKTQTTKKTDWSKSKNRLDLSNYSDQELRNKLNRELLERQYNDVFNNSGYSKAKETVNKILNDIGSILVLTSAGIGIAVGVKQLKN